MRTTITLQPDVAEAVRRLAAERGISFKEAVNTTLRRGLAPTPDPRPFTLEPWDMGLRPGIDLDKANRLVAELDDEEHLRKLTLGK